MWLIIVDKDIEEKRENRISEILNEKVENYYKHYLTFSHGKYTTTLSPHFAKIYKTKSGAERMINQINSDSNKLCNFSSKFYWIKNYQFSVRKLTKEEWDEIINVKLNSLDNEYKRKRERLLKEKDKYHFT